MKNNFVKMHGLGNDFAIFDGRLKRLDFSPETIKCMGDRRTGIGFDQMVIIDAGKGGVDAFLRIYNADGGEVGACGNATRCIARLLINELKKPKVLLETKAGKLEAWEGGERITVNMGPALIDWTEIPLSRKMDTLSVQVEEGMLKAPVAVNMGNPHAVFFVNKSELESVPLTDLGPKVEHHPLFPERVNVEVAHVENPGRIKMRVWERGVGITQACGTGACAVAVAGVRRGLSSRKVTVVLEGGELDIEWRESDGYVLMTGAVAEVYRGEI
jgi:diaminopimelate epimerase